MSADSEFPAGEPALPDRVRLFPLPNLVLFPHVLQPLRIFEPRYLQMVGEALAGDQLIAMALLKPGYELNYEGRPPIHGMCCLGRIVTHHRHENGRYNLLLQGIQRVELLEELPPTKLFREARIQICPDIYPALGSANRSALRQELIHTFRTLLPPTPEAQERLEELLNTHLSLGALTDIVAYTVDLDEPFKQSLLTECNVDRRAEILIEQLGHGGDASAKKLPFPPGFSLN